MTLSQSVKIGLVSTQYGIGTPPLDYGGAERVNWWLYKELINMGYDVTLFATGPSQAYKTGNLVLCPGGGEIEPAEGGPLPPFTEFMKQFRGSCDVWHDSALHQQFGFSNPDLPLICTIHNPNLPRAKNPVMISNAMREQLNQHKAPVVYNGIDLEEYPLYEEKDPYLVYIGYLAGHKGVDNACEFAKLMGMKIILIGHFHEDYKRPIQPYLDSGVADFVGIKTGQEKLDLLGKATAAMFMVQWPEPGNVAALECMALGTPIIATNRGCFPEYVREGENGFIVNNIQEAKEKMLKYTFHPNACRAVAAQQFSSDRMAREYIQQYQRVLNGEQW